eukprot:SAG22_NODE_1412_length_4477_cov_8.593878_3_plen_355_part_00
MQATLAQRAKIVRRQCASLIEFASSLVAFAAGGAEPPPAQRVAAKAAFDGAMASLPAELDAALARFDRALQRNFDEKIVPQLKAGATTAKQQALDTARSWGAGWTRNSGAAAAAAAGGGGGGGGLHWATYKACCRRHGAWRIDMNENLADPVLRGITTNWEKVFVAALPDLLAALWESVGGSCTKFHAELEAALTAEAGGSCDADRLAAIQAPVSNGCAFFTAFDSWNHCLFVRVSCLNRDRCQQLRAGTVSRTAAAAEAVKAEVQRQQKELSRSISPKVQTIMTPGYDMGFAEAGTGSHRRRVVIIERHVDAESKTIFSEAISPILEALGPLRCAGAFALRPGRSGSSSMLVL